MTVEQMQGIAQEVLGSQSNYITRENAAHDELIGLRIYDLPLFGVADAHDPLFLTLRDPKVTCSQALLPTDILLDAVSVISWFLPYEQEIRRQNGESITQMSDAWRHARIEGQDVNLLLGEALCRGLEAEGATAIQVANSPYYECPQPYCSNWSERHVAYIAGLGTFGLSKGLITEKGMAGRFGSIVTNMMFPITKRPYESPFEYCTMCGACARRCPASAIHPELGVAQGKLHTQCGPFVLATTLEQRCGSGTRSRYGCGKCQVRVPCEHGIPLSEHRNG